MILTYCFVLCRALQARVSRQVMMNKEEDDSDDEPKQPERISLADLKHRGKKKAIAPINRAGPAIKSNHINIQINLLQFLKDDTSSSPASCSYPRDHHLNEVFDGFCEQISLQACSHVALQPSATLRTVASWFSMRIRVKVLALQSLGWNHGWPLPPPGQRRMSRGLKGGVMSRYGEKGGVVLSDMNMWKVTQ